MSTVFSPHLFEYNLRGKIKGLILWCLSTACTLILFMLLFSLIIKSGVPSFVSEMLTALPKGMMQNFYFETLPSLGDYSVDVGICLQVIMMIGCIYACHLGVSSIALSENDGTLIFACSQGLNRVSIIITHFIVNLFTIILYNVIIFCVSLWIGMSNNIPELKDLIITSFCAMLIIEVVFIAIGMVASTFIKDLSGMSSISFGLFLFAFLFGTLGYYTDSLSFLKVIGPYHYYSPYMFTTTGAELSTDKIVLSTIMVVLSLVIVVARLAKRDLKS